MTIDLEKVDWRSLLLNSQYGRGNIRVFRGQTGRGFGSVLAAVLRMIPRFLSSTVGSAVTSELVRGGREVLKEATTGGDIKQSLKTQGRQGIRNLVGVGRKKQVGGKRKRKGDILGFVKNRIINKGKGRNQFIPAF